MVNLKKGAYSLIHVKGIIIKFVMIAVVLEIILTGMLHGDFGYTLLISLALTLLAYAFGDLIIFHRTFDHSDFERRNIIATISDAFISFVIIWLFGNALPDGVDNLAIGALISAVVIGVCEWFFHIYLENHVFHDNLYRE
jgi:uncharacterized BrkB/YihY/UPF0761 family membrane protein